MCCFQRCLWKVAVTRGLELWCARVVETERREKAKRFRLFISFLLKEERQQYQPRSSQAQWQRKSLGYENFAKQPQPPGVGSALCGVKDGVQQALVENNLGELTVVNDTVAVHICFSDHFVDFLVLRDVHA